MVPGDQVPQADRQLKHVPNAHQRNSGVSPRGGSPDEPTSECLTPVRLGATRYGCAGRPVRPVTCVDEQPTRCGRRVRRRRVRRLLLTSSRGTLRDVTVGIVFAVVWAAFWVYWLVAALSMKRGRVPWTRELGIRVVLVAVVFVMVRVGTFRSPEVNTHAWRDWLGLAMLGSGLGFAVWARVHIGRNWGMPMTQTTEPDLVTSGPYHFVRHPIYSGILLAAAGSAIAISLTWLIGVVLAALYFAYSATVEERYMAEQFPDAYREYKRSTKMFVPFVV